MKYPISLFTATNKPKVIGFEEFDIQGVENWIRECMYEPTMTKATAPLFNMNEYANDWRCNDNVIRSTGILLDFDSGYTIQAAKEELENVGIWAWLYSSPRHQADAQRFRAVIPLSEPVHNNEDYKRCWHALNELFNREGDKQTKDISRCYYIPGRYETSSEHVVMRTDGELIRPTELFKYYDAYLKKEFDTPPLKPRVVKPQTGSAWMRRLLDKQPTAFTWNNINDCPFVNSTKLAEYLSSPHGSHHGGLFQFACSVAGRARTMGYDLSTNELADIMQEAHFALPCGSCSKTGRKYMVEADKAIRFCG